MLTRAALGLAIILVSGPASAANDFAAALRARLAELRHGALVEVDGARILARRLIPRFYERRGLQPAWMQPAQTHALLALVEASATHGLDPADYHVAALRRRVAPPPDASTAVDRELLFTDALVRLAYHLRFGKVDPRELFPGWSFTRALGAIEPVAALEAVLAAPRLDEAVERFAPTLPAYAELRAALAQLREVRARGGWQRLPAGDALRPGMWDARVPALRERLAQRSAPGADPRRYDDALAIAVESFQVRHGLEVDGIVGRRTLDALNSGVDARIEQVRVNLERLRWVAHDLAGDYLIVDIAGFTARLFLDGMQVWSSRAVVGRPYRRTPVFRARLEYLVLNPSWIVPPTILREDVLPKVARDPDYLARHHMHVVDAAGAPVRSRIEWTRYRESRFPYFIVQAPGDDNALGKIKFMLPNPHAVYLHDTPTRRLFTRWSRALSSGCIRLERPRELALLLLDDAQRWHAEDLDAAIASGETQTLAVRRRVPVLVLYFTAQVGDDGSVRFYPDLYGRDARVARALREPLRFAPVDGVRSAGPVAQ